MKLKRRPSMDDFSFVGPPPRPARRAWWMRLLLGEKNLVDLNNSLASILIFSLGLAIALVGLCVAVFRR